MYFMIFFKYVYTNEFYDELWLKSMNSEVIL